MSHSAVSCKDFLYKVILLFHIMQEILFPKGFVTFSVINLKIISISLKVFLQSVFLLGRVVNGFFVYIFVKLNKQLFEKLF